MLALSGRALLLLVGIVGAAADVPAAAGAGGRGAVGVFIGRLGQEATHRRRGGTSKEGGRGGVLAFSGVPVLIGEVVPKQGGVCGSRRSVRLWEAGHGTGQSGALAGRAAAPSPLGASLQARFAGRPGRRALTAVSASTINGFFTKGFNEPDERGESSDDWSETEDAEGATVRIADCKMPTKRGMFRMRSYRHQSTKRVMRDGEQVLEWVDMEPVVLYKGVKGSPMKENVLVRVHDQCFTSEVMGSRRCDCREQLEMAMELVQKQGGAIIYMPQEGRGIGLANKVAAYHLQDKGLDTVDANRRLGFGDDERVYGCVPFILKDLGIESIQLMTNNPMKVRQLTELGVHVSSRHAAVVPSNQFNEGYLRTKAQRMAHVFNFDDDE